MSKKSDLPFRTTHTGGMRRRAARSPAYEAERRRLAPFERIARIVIRRRTELGLTQQEVAERMGTSHSVISRIESGQHATTMATLERLAEALDAHLVVDLSIEEPAEAREPQEARQVGSKAVLA